MERLKKERKQYRTAATKTLNEADHEMQQTPPSHERLVSLHRQLQEIQVRLREIDNQIKPLLADEEFDREIETMIQYDSEITDAVARLDYRINDRQASNTGVADNRTTLAAPRSASDRQPRVKLPKFELPKFDGSLDKWLPFWTAYELAVHDNSSLTTKEEFCYFSSLLTGNAAAVVKGLNLQEDCYSDTVQLLRSEFGFKERMIQHHINRLTDMPLVKTQRDYGSLRRMHNEIQTSIRSLNAIGLTVDS
ncbi:uncharacterized protein LOC135384405 [Ornithodoros turicata]|uniref:uncharacterized protein LOC135384405 n=1 Tax=Ornithodoros turicata TaxID=34597 RepID=UPI0031388193